MGIARKAFEPAASFDIGGNMIFIGCAVAGVLLGLRFKVFVLVPACLIAAAIVFPSSHGLRATALMVFVAVVLIQIGYITGGLLRVLVAGRMPPWRSARVSRNGPERDIH
jgi:hypothetical protein